MPRYKAVLSPCINGEAMSLGIKLLEFRVFKAEDGICEDNDFGIVEINVDIGFIPRNAEKRNEEAGTAASWDVIAEGTFSDVNCETIIDGRA